MAQGARPPGSVGVGVRGKERDVMAIKDLRVSVIGAGALGGAVARGLAKAGCRVLGSDSYPERLDRVRADGVELISDNAQAASEGQVVLFALKPHLTLGVVRELAPLLKGKLCVSLAAAVTLNLLVEAAPEARWGRAMSNICAAMNVAFTGVVPSASCTGDDRTLLLELFSLVGSAELTEERNLDALTSLTGSGPAFFLSLLEGAAMGGIHAGLPKALAYKGAAAAALGAARLALESGKAPAELRDDVCTPGGTTIEGIAELERSGARGAMMRAVLAAAEKGRVLTEKVMQSLK